MNLDYQKIFDQALFMYSQNLETAGILKYVASESEKLMQPGSAVSILLIDENGLLTNGASPSLPVDYLKAIDRIKPDPNVGTCAAAAATGQIVITTSFLTDEKWSELKHLPLSLGYAGAWSVPIKNQENKTLGTIGVYQKQVRIPDEKDVNGIKLLSEAVSQVLTCSAAA